MRSKLSFAVLLTLLLTASAVSASAQADYAAHDTLSRFAVGGGISLFDPDYGPRPILGPAVWADFHPPIITNFVPGLGIEAEARGILWNRGDYKDLYESTVSGGVIYHPGVVRFHHFAAPYVKFLVGQGWNPYYAGWGPPFIVYTAGGGIDYNLSRRLVLRGDYEFQDWRGVPSHEHSGQPSSDTPQGITIGVLYRFGGSAR